MQIIPQSKTFSQRPLTSTTHPQKTTPAMENGNVNRATLQPPHLYTGFTIHDVSQKSIQNRFSVGNILRVLSLFGGVSQTLGSSDLVCGSFASNYSSRDIDSSSSIQSMRSSSLILSSFKDKFDLFWPSSCSDNTQAFNAFLASSELNPSQVFVNPATVAKDVIPALKAPVEVGTPTCTLPSISVTGYSDLHRLSFQYLDGFYYPNTFEDSNRYRTKPNGDMHTVGADLTTTAQILIQYVIDNTDPSLTEVNMRSYFETQSDFPEIPHCVSVFPSPTVYPTTLPPTHPPTTKPTHPNTWGNRSLICGAYSLTDSIRSVESSNEALSLIQTSTFVLDSFKEVFLEFQKTCSSEKALNSFLAFADLYPQFIFQQNSTNSRDIIPSVKDPISVGSPTCLVTTISNEGYSELKTLAFTNLQTFYYTDKFEDHNRYETHHNGTYYAGKTLTDAANILIQYMIENTDPAKSETDMLSYFKEQVALEWPNVPFCSATIPSPTFYPSTFPPTQTPTLETTNPEDWGSHELVCGAYSTKTSIRSVNSAPDALNTIFSSNLVKDSFKTGLSSFQDLCPYPTKTLNAFVQFSELYPDLVFQNSSWTNATTVIPHLVPPISIESSTCTLKSITNDGYSALHSLVFNNMQPFIPSYLKEDSNRFLTESSGAAIQVGTRLDYFASQMTQYAIGAVDTTLTNRDTKAYFETQTDFPKIPHCSVPESCPPLYVHMYREFPSESLAGPSADKESEKQSKKTYKRENMRRRFPPINR